MQMYQHQHLLREQLMKVTKTVAQKLQLILWPDKIFDDDLIRRTGQLPVVVLFRGKKWQWIGRTFRKDDECIAGYAMETIFLDMPMSGSP